MKLVAIHSIRRNPTGAREATGELDKAGNNIFRSVTENVAPGEHFEEHDEAEAQWLIDNGAAVTPEQKALDEAAYIATMKAERRLSR